MSWKQPVPTDINDDRNFTAFDRAVFREILCLCQNKDYVANFIHAGRSYRVELKRGQCIFKVRNYAKEMKVDRKRIQKSIATLSKWYTQMDSRAMPYGLIITVKDYDELTKMESQMESSGSIAGPKRDHRGATNKSDKSIKIEKSEEIIYNPKPTVSVSASYKAFVDLFNQITGKKFRYGDKKASSQLQARLKDGYTREDIEKAIRNCFKDPYHQENPKYLTPEFITRTSKLEMYLEATEPLHTGITQASKLSFGAQEELLKMKRKAEREAELARLDEKYTQPIAIENKDK